MAPGGRQIWVESPLPFSSTGPSDWRLRDACGEIDLFEQPSRARKDSVWRKNNHFDLNTQHRSIYGSPVTFSGFSRPDGCVPRVARGTEGWPFGFTRTPASEWRSTAPQKMRSEPLLKAESSFRRSSVGVAFGVTSPSLAPGVADRTSTKQVEVYAVRGGSDWLVITVIAQFLC